MTKQEILQYVLDTPHNTNVTILEQKIDEYVGENIPAGGSDEKILYMDAKLLNAGGEYPVDADDYTVAVIPAEASFISVDAFSNLPKLDTLIINGNCEFELYEEYLDMGTNRYNAITKYSIPIRKLIVQDRTEAIPPYFMFRVYPLTEAILTGSIDTDAFEYCSYLKKVTLENCQSIGHWAFAQCSSLTDIVIPDGVTSIGGSVFYNCTNLKEITIPDSVTTLGASTFGGCTNLATVTILGTEVTFSEGSIPTTTIIRGYTGSTAETYAKANGNVFEPLDLPFTVTSSNRDMIGFTGADSEALVIPRTFSDDEGTKYYVAEIGDNAFSGCSNLASVFIPNTVTHIGAQAFSECAKLEMITFDGKISKFDAVVKDTGWRDGPSVVIMCSDGEWLDTVDLVVTSDNRSIVGYTGVDREELVIPAIFKSDDGTAYKVVEIGADAFQNCSGLASVTIPYTVTNIDTNAFTGSDNTEVILHLNVAKLDAGGVYPINSNRINSVIIPEDATFLDFDVFNTLTGIETVYYNAIDCEAERNTYIDGKGNTMPYYTALANIPLKNFIIGDRVNSIPAGLCYNCFLISNVVIPANVSFIGERAFYNCFSLLEVTVFNPQVEFSYYVFHYSYEDNYGYGYPYGRLIYGYAGSTTETYVNQSYGTFEPIMEEKVLYMDASLLNAGGVYPVDADDYTTAVISAEATFVSVDAFEGLTKLRTLEINGNCEFEISVVDYDMSTGYFNAITKNNIPIKKLVVRDRTSIPDQFMNGVETLREVDINITGSIGQNAFYSCDYLRYVTLNGVTSIGGYAFQGCSNLTEIILPESVTEIGNGAFYGTSITAIDIPDGVTCINGYTFESTKLVEVIIPDGITSIGYDAFAYCNKLERVTIPNSVTNIQQYAFRSCYNLKQIIFDGTMIEWRMAIMPNWNGDGSSMYGEHSKIEVVCTDGILPPSDEIAVYSGNRESYGYTGAENEELVLPEPYQDGSGVVHQIHSIDGAFNSCSNLVSVTIPDKVVRIGEYTFQYCSNLTSVTIPKSIAFIERYAFYNCSNLTEITLPDSVKILGENAFSQCSNLTKINIPAGITSIEYSTFGGCSSLTNITIPDSVTSIDNYAFSDCTGLTEITIPASVTEIPESVFYNCSSLTTITILGMETTIVGDDNYPDIPQTAKIRGYAGSAIEAWANEYSYTFEVIE